MVTPSTLVVVEAKYGKAFGPLVEASTSVEG
jgi:hypothetical protein